MTTITIREHKVKAQLRERYQALDRCLSEKRLKKQLFTDICGDIDRLEAMLAIVNRQ